MADFWRLARMMLAHRGLLIASVCFAAMSAFGFGVGLAGLAPILSNIIPRVDEHGQRIPGHDLPELVTKLNERIGGHIPQSWIDALPTGPFNAVVWIIMALGVLTIVGGFANFMHSYLSLTVVSRTIADLRKRCFEHVVHLPLRTVMASPSQFVSQIVYDTNGLAGGLSALVSKSLAQLTKAGAAVVVAFFTDWRLAGAAMLIAPVLALVIRKSGQRIRRAAKRGLESQGGLYQTTAEAVDNLRVVKASTAETREQGRFEHASTQALRNEMRVRTARSLASPVVEVLAIFTVGTLSMIAAKAIIDGNLDFQRFVITMTALGFAGASLKPMTGLLNDIQQSTGAANRLCELLATEREPGFDPALPRLARHQRDIVFDNVSLTYPNQETPAVRNVSLTVRHGETVAFVGANGSGKTSLLSLLPRLFDPDTPADGSSPGRVLIDGVDVRSVHVGSLRQQIGVVTQETVLFRGTIRANIAFGRDDATDEAITDAARRARAHDFIMARPRQYDDQIGERGSGLSGGQRQRIAIARAILRDPAILILDEATSMIDADSEARIAEALDEFSRGRTCLIVAHRLSTVVHADRIVVMDAGRIADVGTHAELFERCAAYRLIAERQLVRHDAPTPPAEPVAASSNFK
ncbi:MAG: ABC transporter ATP-binding protein [Phycisphaeraceae bacterium]|nr:ABC transporter ATP-binding protein [Phycisphaeraceae bacterium]